MRLTDAGAATDFDHFYYTDGGQACTGPGCEAVSLVGWTMSPSQQCRPVPTIGLIDTGIDRDHEALQGQSIDVLPMPQVAVPHRSAITAPLSQHFLSVEATATLPVFFRRPISSRSMPSIAMAERRIAPM